MSRATPRPTDSAPLVLVVGCVWPVLWGLLILLIQSQALAKDLGVIGPVYPIGERDLLQVIEAKLRAKEESGELARMQAQARKRIERRIEQPEPVAGLAKATERRTHYLDPTVSVPEDIRDADGRFISAAGSQVNPLDTVSLSKVLLFFDARDKAQVRKAKALMAHYEKAGAVVKPILVGGSYMDFQRRHKVRVWYDQAGRICHQLGITHVPAIVTQEGRRLRIDEVPS